ncbi:MAG TPA: LuxR family transcriptional regulator [Burkholderiaceae bacterium]|nr:LuxR family transcriptional regulator [Burkholderiaceae bacterium]
MDLTVCDRPTFPAPGLGADPPLPSLIGVPPPASPAPLEGHGVLLYSERDLAPREDGRRRHRMPGLVTDLLEAGSAEERERLVRAMLHAIGFEWLAYGTVVQLRGQSVPRTFFTSYAHPGWTQRYFRERYHEIDPRHQDAPCSSLPLVWDLQDVGAGAQARAGALRVRRFLDDFRDSGIRSGVFFSLASPVHPHERTVISLMSSSPNRRWIVESVLGQALTLGLSLHEFLSRQLPPHTPQHPATAHLSPLQRDILDCLIRGQSDKEIASRLHLSLHKVDYHLRQLRRRFAVRNRVQLVNAAVQSAYGG